jgi:REP element-mobilizing transposase RayT
VGTPLAYFLTFTCYGTWLHGDERGSVDEAHNVQGTPVLPADPARRSWEEKNLAQPPYHLDGPRRQVVLLALSTIARRKGWFLHAAHVRSNHVHLVVKADGPPERVLNEFKAAASRRLNKTFPTERDRLRWTRHGSTRYLWTVEAIAEKVHYVLFGQGEPMERFPDLDQPCHAPSENDPSRARSESCRSRARSESSSGVSGSDTPTPA